MPGDTEELTCLSMHQPWASLVVYGLKRIEGRTWDCHHRGRLWIHATAKAVDPADVEELTAFYTQIHSLDGGRVPAFPPAYPTGVLLGCVEVVDVLPRDLLGLHWPQLPDSCRLEATSPFCFLCQNPKRLVVPQPLRGQQRLWQLTRATLKVALQGLRDPPGLQPFCWRDYGDPRVTTMALPTSAAAPPPPRPQRQRQTGQQPQRSGEQGDVAAGQDGGGGGGGVKDDEEGGGGGGADDVPRRIRALRKKLRMVSELEALQRSFGAAALGDDQAAKLARAGEWRRELAALEAAM